MFLRSSPVLNENPLCLSLKISIHGSCCLPVAKLQIHYERGILSVPLSFVFFFFVSPPDAAARRHSCVVAHDVLHCARVESEPVTIQPFSRVQRMFVSNRQNQLGLRLCVLATALGYSPRYQCGLAMWLRSGQEEVSQKMFLNKWLRDMVKNVKNLMQQKCHHRKQCGTSCCLTKTWTVLSMFFAPRKRSPIGNHSSTTLVFARDANTLREALYHHTW